MSNHTVTLNSYGAAGQLYLSKTGQQQRKLVREEFTNLNVHLIVANKMQIWLNIGMQLRNIASWQVLLPKL